MMFLIPVLTFIYTAAIWSVLVIPSNGKRTTGARAVTGSGRSSSILGIVTAIAGYDC